MSAFDHSFPVTHTRAKVNVFSHGIGCNAIIAPEFRTPIDAFYLQTFLEKTCLKVINGFLLCFGLAEMKMNLDVILLSTCFVRSGTVLNTRSKCTFLYVPH